MQNKKMKKLAKFEKIGKLLYAAVALGLLLMAGYSVRLVWNNYQSKDTSTKVSKILQFMTRPTITICFQPSTKQTILNKYNVTMLEFFWSNTKNLSIPWLDFYDEVGIKIGRDFNITYRYSPTDYNEDYYSEKNLVMISSLMKGLNSNITFTELHTMWNGRCYKLTPKLQVLLSLICLLY